MPHYLYISLLRMQISASCWTTRRCMTFASEPLSSPPLPMVISITLYQLPYVVQLVLFVSRDNLTATYARYGKEQNTYIYIYMFMLPHSFHPSSRSFLACSQYDTIPQAPLLYDWLCTPHVSWQPAVQNIVCIRAYFAGYSSLSRLHFE